MSGPNVIKLYLMYGDEEEETMSNLALEVRSVCSLGMFLSLQ